MAFVKKKKRNDHIMFLFKSLNLVEYNKFLTNEQKKKKEFF